MIIKYKLSFKGFYNIRNLIGLSSYFTLLIAQGFLPLCVTRKKALPSDKENWESSGLHLGGGDHLTHLATSTEGKIDAISDGPGFHYPGRRFTPDFQSGLSGIAGE